MRRKKHKHTRRTVSFFKVNYQFREPFKVLLDGNFIHAARSTNLADLDKHLGALLNGRLKLFVTPCIMHELRSLGPEFKETANAARKLQLHHCGHLHPHHPPVAAPATAAGIENPSGTSNDHDREEQGGEEGPGNEIERTDKAGGKDAEGTTAREGEEAGGGGTEGRLGSRRAAKRGLLAAAECIKAQIGSQNLNHWWVATQDKILRDTLGQIPGTPILFATVHGLHLETPSEMTKTTAKEAGEDAMALPLHERKSEVLKDLEQIRPKLTTNVRYRRNRAKGPNPLASKKKKTKVSSEAARKVVPAAKSSGEGNAEGGEGKRKRKRKRGATAGQPP